MKMKYFTKEVKIGLTGIIAIAVLIYGINFLKGINMFKASTGYYVEFENIAGLVNSSPVYADGFGVGIVRDIHYNYNKPGHVVVEIDLDKNMKLSIGTKAELETEMLGTVKMNLIFPRDGHSYHEIGDTIKGTVNGGMLATAGTLVPKVESMLPKLDSILSSIDRLLADQSVSNTLHNTEQITSNLKATTHELNTLLQEEIPSITRNLNVITANFATVSDNLKGIDYAATVKQINQTLESVRMFTDRLQSSDNNVGLLLNDDALYKNLVETTGNAASLLENIQENPKRYVHFSIFGRKN